MKINRILESFNKMVDSIRFTRGLNVNGHFVAVTSFKKAMGPYKTCHIVIDYINLDSHENFSFCHNICTDTCYTGEEDKLEEQCTEEVLVKFFTRWEKFREAVIIGDYGCE